MLEQELARRTLSIISKNEMNFRLDQAFKNTVRSFSNVKGDFTPEQLSMIDGLYEKYMKFGGFPSISVKHDFKKS
jgi:predicted AAA+ superfamily ATPase